MKAKLCIEDLTVHYGAHQALEKINLSIYDKQITALIGPSGCGKSTFLCSLNRLNEGKDIKTSGKILLDDRINIFKMNEITLRTEVGMIFQKPNPFPMSIFDNVAYGLKCQGLKNKNKLNSIVEEALRGAFLWDDVKDVLNKSALQLSGGQQQRLCIARAIAMKPSVLLMDEPTSALDPIATEKIEQLIKRLKERYTIVIVTHSMDQAKRISDYTAFFFMGKMVEFNETKQIFTTPQAQETKDYVMGRYI